MGIASTAGRNKRFGHLGGTRGEREGCPPRNEKSAEWAWPEPFAFARTHGCVVWDRRSIFAFTRTRGCVVRDRRSTLALSWLGMPIQPAKQFDAWIVWQSAR